MYYQVVYTDLRTGRRTHSAMIHRSKAAAKTEMNSKIKTGHKKVIIVSGKKLS